MVHWLPGVFAPKVEVVTSEDEGLVLGGRGCIARDHIPPWEPVVKVDSEAVIRVQVDSSDGVPWYIRLALRFLKEKSAGENSNFSEYVSMMDSIRDGERSVLMDRTVSRDIHWYEYLRADVENYYRAVEDSFDGELMDLCRSITEWRRALWISHSRAFALPPTGKEIALIPMVDMFNHVTRANSELVYDEVTNSYDIVFENDLSAGEEILITYGGLSNDILLPYFNFIEHANPVDTYYLTYRQLAAALRAVCPPTHGSAEEPEARQDGLPSQLQLEVLQRAGAHWEGERGLLIGLDGPSETLMLVTRVLISDEETLHDSDPSSFAKAKDLSSELVVWETLESVLEAEEERISKWLHKSQDEGVSPTIVDFAKEKIRTISSSLRVVRWWRDVSERVGRVTTVLLPPGRSTIPVPILDERGMRVSRRSSQFSPESSAFLSTETTEMFARMQTLSRLAAGGYFCRNRLRTLFPSVVTMSGFIFQRTEFVLTVPVSLRTVIALLGKHEILPYCIDGINVFSRRFHHGSLYTLDVLEQFGISLSCKYPLLEHTVQMLEFHKQNSRLHCIQSGVCSHQGKQLSHPIFAVHSERPNRSRNGAVRCENCTAISAASQWLGREKGSSTNNTTAA
ncbi:hypothetical protein NDN08_001308 [Rhodosorus marinus]|uniref:SET domain-containing protein n=1 Tax=Rhodosorus marinus TaxID=101924 RepID=A0AAV8UUL5_9RHOD|nr:hypothetical protein NDN08_001308 [Rhodosorus marinus]